MDRTADLRIVCDVAPTPEDVARVRAGLMSFNEAAAGPAHLKRLAFYLRDGGGEIHGGLVGYLAWQWLSIELLWVDDSLRGRGYGSALLRQAEAMALEAGCIAARLDTYEFQARPFYEGRGYVVFAVLEGYPAGTRTYSLRKPLV